MRMIKRAQCGPESLGEAWSGQHTLNCDRALTARPGASGALGDAHRARRQFLRGACFRQALDKAGGNRLPRFREARSELCARRCVTGTNGNRCPMYFRTSLVRTRWFCATFRDHGVNRSFRFVSRRWQPRLLLHSTWGPIRCHSAANPWRRRARQRSPPPSAPPGFPVRQTR